MMNWFKNPGLGKKPKNQLAHPTQPIGQKRKSFFNESF